MTFRLHAADNAVRLFAYDEAEEHYDWALRSIEKLPAESRPAAALALHRRRGTVRLEQARFDDATADFEAMLEVARGIGDSAGELAALAGLCDALFYARRVEEMAARAQELLEAATRTGGVGDRAEAHARIGQAFVGQGRFEEAVPRLDGAIETSRRVGAPVALKIALSYRGLVHYWQTEYQATETACVEALSLSTRLGDGFYALAARMFLGLTRVHLGRISEGLDDFADAISVARRNDDRYWLPRLVSHLGWVHRELGALDRAREHDTDAVRLARERPAWGPESEVLLNLCVDRVREGQAERASALLAELEARAAASTWMRWLSELRLAAASAEHWAVRGDHERTVEHAVRLTEMAARLGARDYRCAGERIRAAVALALGRASSQRPGTWARPSPSCAAGPPRSRTGSRRGSSRCCAAERATTTARGPPSRRPPAPSRRSPPGRATRPCAEASSPNPRSGRCWTPSPGRDPRSTGEASRARLEPLLRRVGEEVGDPPGAVLLLHRQSRSRRQEVGVARRKVSRARPEPEEGQELLGEDVVLADEEPGLARRLLLVVAGRAAARGSGSR